MTLDATRKLGKTLGGQSTELDTVKQNISPDESESQDQIVIFDDIKLSQELKIYGKQLPEAFVLDHPVLSKLGGSLSESKLWYEVYDFDTSSTTGYTEINYLEDLSSIPAFTTGNYKLMRDLDYNDDASYSNPANKASWQAGTGFTGVSSPFRGVFDGQGHTISNIYFLSTSTYGFFRALGYPVNGGVAIIRNLQLHFSYFNCTSTWGGMLSGRNTDLIGANPGTCLIENCIVSGYADAVPSYSGALAGQGSSRLTVRNCKALVVADGVRLLGLVMDVNNATVKNCLYLGDSSTTGVNLNMSFLGTLGSGCFYNSDLNTSTNGTGKTTEELALLSTYTDASFDITNQSTHNGTGSPSPWVLTSAEDPLEFNQGYVSNLVTIPITMPVKIGTEVTLLYDSEA